MLNGNGEVTSKIANILFGSGWVRLCETVNTKGSLISLDTLEDETKLSQFLKRSPDKDWYSSLYYYGEDAKKHWDSKKSMAGYKGSAFSKKLLFDFDDKAIVTAKDDAMNLLIRLQQEGVEIADHTRVFFSGGKGFHIELLLDQAVKPEKLKTICMNLASGFNTFDPVVYNTTRLIRLRDTKHQGSGLYKIELDPQDLVDLSVEDIKKKAENKSTYKSPSLVFGAADLIKKYEKEETKAQYDPTKTVAASSTNGIRGLDRIDFTRCPKTTPRCIFALEHGVMASGQGERNHVFLRLAAWYRNQGLTKDVAYNTLKGVARENARLYPEHKAFDKSEIWSTVINSVYSDHGAWKTVTGAVGTGIDNELLNGYCEAVGHYTTKKCCLHSKSKNAKAVRIDEVAGIFSNFAENFDKNVVRTGINFIDTNMNIAVGTSTLLVGAAGSGKTTLALNIMENANALGQHTMFFSMDMHRNLLFLKLAQKLTNWDQKTILQFYKDRDEVKKKIIKDRIADKYGRTYFDFSGTLTLDEISDRILNIEEQTGNDIKLVVIDYASRITSQFGDTYANARHNALKSKEVADDTNSAFIIISQISRNVGDGCTPLRTKRAAKESGDWEESASNVITCWRPFMGDQSRDDVIRVFLAKNRMGPELEQPLYWNGAKGIVRDMTPMDLKMYQDPQSGTEKEEKDYLKSKNGRL